MDTVVFDIETSNFFTDPDVGRNNFARLRISLVVLYSYLQDKYFCFEENQLMEAAELMRPADALVGFSINRYDVPVLNHHFQRLGLSLNLFEKNRVDLLDEIELITGKRISLELLAQANLGMGKLGHGPDAARLFAEGRMDELKAYCEKDVELTKGLYDLYSSQKYFLIPDRETNQLNKVEFSGLAGLVGR